jgi:flavin reductase (DIM6/NTAB) family NADH-FMN oxidoreductase RutF
MMTVTRTADPCRALRTALGRYATGVAVMTTRYRGRPIGLTVNSFTSVSLAPPLVLWCLSNTSGSRTAFGAAQYFAVNILSARQRGLAVRFAGPGDRFARLTHRVDAHQLPLLDGSVCSLICRRDRLIPAGDHVVLIGSVLDYGARSGVPLVFVDGTYHGGPVIRPGPG